MADSNRGLANADEETRKRVASEGGKAQHDNRGMANADEETRKRVSHEGGQASGGNFKYDRERASEAGKVGAAHEPVEAKRRGGENSHRGNQNS